MRCDDARKAIAVGRRIVAFLILTLCSTIMYADRGIVCIQQFKTSNNCYRRSNDSSRRSLASWRFRQALWLSGESLLVGPEPFATLRIVSPGIVT